MNSHLSNDQMSRCVLGQARSEEAEHGRNCPQCSAELVRFADAVATFQGVMKDWSEGEPVPQLEKTPLPLPWRRWALAGVAVAVLAVIPAFEYWVPQPVVPEPETHSDELLMEEVAAHLSRPLPLSMERVMVLLPEVEKGSAPEREEVR